MKKQILTLAALTALLLMGSGSKALAGLQMKLMDNLGNTVTITDNGVGDNDPTVGSIKFLGAVGPNWILNVTAGISKPVAGSASAPELDISTLNFSAGAGTLDIQLSDTDFTTGSPVTYQASVGGTTSGSVTFNTWADGGNVALAETTLLTSQGPFSTSPFSGNQSAVKSPGGSPYALTLDTTITHAAGGTTSFDANLIGSSSSSPQPALSLVKTASTNTANVGQPVTYYYAVTNNGNVTVNNINIVDDNGTPKDTSDDFYVNAAPFSLNAGQGAVFAIPHISEALCMTNGGTNLYVGTMTVNVLNNGDVAVYFLQSQGIVDNRYGTNATAATGWYTGQTQGPGTLFQ